MKNYTESAKVGLTLCSQSYLVGGNWGYLINEHNDYEMLVGILSKDKSTVRTLNTSNGVIVLANKEVLHELISQVEPELLTENTIKAHKTRAAVERNKCLKLFEDIVKGIDKNGTKYQGFTEYNIGIYCSNEINKIRLNGLDYPAFKMTIQEIIDCLKQLNRFKTVYLKVMVEGNMTFMRLQDLVQIEDYLSTVTKALEISPTGTGVFITIRVE